jgi:hypothetical protein
MKYTITTILMVTLFATASHAGSAKTVLSEQLKGKSASEQRETLRLACLNGAEVITGRTSMWKKSGHSSIPVHDAKVEKMKNLCREMSEAYLVPEDTLQNLAPAAGGSIKTSDKMAELTKECAAQLRDVDNTKNASALQSMKQICEIYTSAR